MTPPARVLRIVHAIHVVRDIHATRRRYQDVLGALAFAEGHHEVEDRDMNLLYVANFMVEPMAPRSPSTILGRYLERHGEGLQSIELKVSGLETPRRALEERGVRLTSPYPSFFFTHPKDAFGLMLEVTTAEMPNDPAKHRGWSWDWVRGHASTLERLACIVFAVRDLESARDMLCGVFGAELVGESRLERPEALQQCYLSLAGELLCLVRPLGEGLVARYIEGRGPGLYSLVWKVESEEAARRHFQGRGAAPSDQGAAVGRFSLDPAAMFGARHEFTERSVA